MPNAPSQEYLYSLNPPPAPRSPKKRRWVVAVVTACLLLLLCMLALLLPHREAVPPVDTHGLESETSPCFDTETVGSWDDTEPVVETETVDRYGFYEGNEVIVGVSGYEPDFPQEDCDYEKTAVKYYYDYSGKLGKGPKIADDAAPATYQLASAGVFTEQTLYYQRSYGDEQVSYRLYSDESGYYTYLFTVDGRLVEYDMPADGIAPFEDDDVAIQVALDFLCSVGVEITDEYTCAVMERSKLGLFDTEPKEGRASRVIVTRNIGGMIGEGYIVYCGMSSDAPEVIYSRVINPGMYEAFGYITEEQVEHTRRRLYEAIGLLEQDRCDSYELIPYRRELLVMSGGHLYLCVWITPVGVDPNYYGDVGGGICQMRIDP